MCCIGNIAKLYEDMRRIIFYVTISSVRLLGYSLKACFSLLWVDSAYVIKPSMDGFASFGNSLFVMNVFVIVLYQKLIKKKFPLDILINIPKGYHFE